MKAMMAAAVLLLGNASFGQGTINFNTRFPAAGVNAPVNFVPWELSPLGPAYSAGLYLVSGGNKTLLPSSITRFRDMSSNPLLGQYVEPVVVEVPGTSAGSIVTVQMRAWRTADGSWEGAAPERRGESGFLTVTVGGGPMPPGDLPASFTGFYFLIPEPQAWALGAIGVVVFGLAAQRRR